MDLKKVANDLATSIEKLDYLRPSDKIYMGKWIWRSIRMTYPYLKEYDLSFFNEIDEYERMFFNRASKESRKSDQYISQYLNTIFLFILFFIFLITASVLVILLLKFQFIIFIFTVMSLIALIFLYKIMMPSVFKNRNLIFERYDEELKTQANKIINYFKNFLKENNLNPKDFPIELRHDDYDNLTYENKGKKFIAYVRL